MTYHPMLQLDLRQGTVAARYGELSNLADLAHLIRDAKGNRAATEFLVNGIGLRSNQHLNEDYYRGAFAYQLGMLLAHLGQEEAAADNLKQSGVLPLGGGDPEFSFAVAESLRLYEHQSQAAAEGVPSILITAMPHSGSASLTQTLAATLNAPIMRLSAGHFPGFVLIPRWLDCFSRGGAVVHDHFGASPFNLRTLKESGWRDLWVLVRDPRASAATHVRNEMSDVGLTYPPEHLERRIVDYALNAFIPWLQGWIDAQQTMDLRMHWIKFKETTANMPAAVRGLLDRLIVDHRALEELLAEPTREVRGNFFRGDDEAWRESVGDAARRHLWDAMSPEAIELLELEP